MLSCLVFIYKVFRNLCPSYTRFSTSKQFWASGKNSVSQHSSQYRLFSSKPLRSLITSQLQKQKQNSNFFLYKPLHKLNISSNFLIFFYFQIFSISNKQTILLPLLFGSNSRLKYIQPSLLWSVEQHQMSVIPMSFQEDLI